jgi:membrane fusion protein, heavy metal efflux system
MRNANRGAMRPRGAAALCLVAWLAAAGCHGHDHEGVHGVAGEGLPGGGAVTLWTERTELFMEHPALLAGEPAKLLVHLTTLADFEPLRSGTLALRFEPEEGGEPVELVEEAPRAPGIYGPVVTLPRAGRWDLRLSIESPQGNDVLRVAGLPVYASRADLPEAESATDDGITFGKEQQWQAPGFRTAFAEEGSLPAGIEAPGEIVPAAGRYAEVGAPVAGLVDAEGARRAPAPGEAVEKGQVLALLIPALGESGSAVAGARAALREAEHEHARAARLLEVEAVPERRLEEARIRLDAAREALASLAGDGVLEPDGRIALRSPIAGVVAMRDLAVGSRVAAGDRLFAVVDPSVVWLRAHVPAVHAPRIGAEAGASFALEGDGARGEASRMVAVGSTVDAATRTVAVLYEVANPQGAIKVGAHARVVVRTGEVTEGVVIPDGALLEEDGRPIAYVQVEGERFERRELVLGPRAFGQVLVREGVSPGERVVTGAAYQVRLASLSTAVPAHGHDH